MQIRYLNTDLEIESKSDLSRVVQDFGEDLVVLYCGEVRTYQHASFEFPVNTAGADETINHFCALVEGLGKEARDIWDGCCSRVIDVGYESGTSPQSFRSEIGASTIQRVAAIGASIVVTIYSVPKPA